MGELVIISGFIFEGKKKREKLYSKWLKAKLIEGIELEKLKKHLFDAAVYEAGFKAMEKKLEAKK